MNKIRDWAHILWYMPLVKEGILLVVTSVALTSAIELSKLLDLLNNVDTVASAWTSGKAWFVTFFNAVVLTALRQAIAYGIARLGSNKLDDA